MAGYRSLVGMAHQPMASLDEVIGGCFWWCLPSSRSCNTLKKGLTAIAASLSFKVVHNYEHAVTSSLLITTFVYVHEQFEKQSAKLL